jgi:hypothetical protein
MALISKLISGTTQIATSLFASPLKYTGSKLSQAFKAADSALTLKGGLSEAASGIRSEGVSFTKIFKDELFGTSERSTLAGKVLTGSRGVKKSISSGFSSVKNSGFGRFAAPKLNKVGGLIGKGWEKTPAGPILLGTAFTAGIAYGAGNAMLRKLDERNQRASGRGMSANNLGTDGLTLALSKRRHR